MSACYGILLFDQQIVLEPNNPKCLLDIVMSATRTLTYSRENSNSKASKGRR